MQSAFTSIISRPEGEGHDGRDGADIDDGSLGRDQQMHKLLHHPHHGEHVNLEYIFNNCIDLKISRGRNTAIATIPSSLSAATTVIDEEASKRIIHKHIEFPAGPECHFVSDSLDIRHLCHVELDYLNPKGVLQLLDRLKPSCRGKNPESCSCISPCSKVARGYSREGPLAWNSFASSPPIPPMPALNRQRVSHCPYRGGYGRILLPSYQNTFTICHCGRCHCGDRCIYETKRNEQGGSSDVGNN